MASYYYLLASMPLLLFGRKPPIDSSRFLEAARGQCAPAVFSELEKAVLKADDEESSFSFTRRWAEREKSLSWQLAQYRAGKTGLTADMDREAEDVPDAWLTVKQMTSAADPFAAELILDKSRWAFAEELEKGHSYDVENVFAYNCKLRILERRFAMSPDNGKTEYDKIISGQKELFKNVSYTGVL